MALKLIGHRGNGQTLNSPFTENKAPEHTLLSFRQAFENGADGVEFDIYLTKDGIPIINCRETIDDKNLTTMSFRQIRNSVSLPMGERVPCLEEALELFAEVNEQLPNRDFIINVELKGHGVVEATMKTIRPFVDNHALSWDQIAFSAFDWDKLSLAQEIEPRARLQPTIATVHLFNADEVQMPGYHVSLASTYNQAVLDRLGSYIQTRRCTAIDTPTLDIRPELIAYAEEWGTGFCTHPTGPRRSEQAPRLHETIHLLDEFSQRTSATVCMKVDDIQVAKSVIEDTRQGRPYDMQKLSRLGGIGFI